MPVLIQRKLVDIHKDIVQLDLIAYRLRHNKAAVPENPDSHWQERKERQAERFKGKGKKWSSVDLKGIEKFTKFYDEAGEN